MHTIAKYPNFNVLDKKHQGIIDDYTRVFAPYCDIRFSVMMAWSEKKYPAMIANINNNLLIKLNNYIAGENFVILLGENQLQKSMETIFEKEKVMRLVPEEIVLTIEKSAIAKRLIIEPDQDNFDYILDLKKISELKSPELRSKSKSIKKFLKHYPNVEVVILEPSNHKTKEDLKLLLAKCSYEKQHRVKEVEEEFLALTKYIKNHELYKALIIGIRINGELVSYSGNEITGNIAHGLFGRAITKYKGLHDYTEFKTAEILFAMGEKYINLQQDMGIEGMRKYKLSWKPDRILKKLTIYKKQTLD